MQPERSSSLQLADCQVPGARHMGFETDHSKNKQPFARDICFKLHRTLWMLDRDTQDVHDHTHDMHAHLSHRNARPQATSGKAINDAWCH